MQRSLLLVVLATTACGRSHTDHQQPPPPPPPADAAPPPIDAPPPDPLAERQRACTGGDPAACDAIAEFWSEREILRPARATQAAADRDALAHACDDLHQSAACMGLALMWKYGTAGSVDPDATKRYFGLTAEYGDLNGWRGKPPEAAGAAALAAVSAECDKGRARACDQLGWAAFGAIQRDKNVADAQAAYARGCTLGSGQGCRWAGHFAFTYPEVGHADEARGLLERGCDALNTPGACAELGIMLDKSGDPAGALPRLQQSCDEGNRAGCFHLGRVQMATDPAAGLPHLLEACAAGEDGACAAMPALVSVKPAACTVPAAANTDQAAQVLAAAKTYCAAPNRGPDCKAVPSCK